MLLLNADGTFTYTPDADFHGADGFTYEITDPSGAVSQAVVTITVDPVNDAPVAEDDNLSTAAGGTVSFSAADLTGNDRDVDGDVITLASYTQPAGGVVFEDADGGLVYAPHAGFVGVDSFTYTATDPDGAQATAVVVVNVTGTGTSAPDTEDQREADAESPPDGIVDFPAERSELEEATRDAEDENVFDESLAGGGGTAELDLSIPGLDASELPALDGRFYQEDDDRSDWRESAPAKSVLAVLHNMGYEAEYIEYGSELVNLTQKELFAALDMTRMHMESHQGLDEVRSVLMTQIATGTGIALTAGYVAWILHGDTLFSMLVSSTPLWKGFDALPLLAARKKKKDEEDDEQKDEPRTVEELLDSDTD